MAKHEQTSGQHRDASGATGREGQGRGRHSVPRGVSNAGMVDTHRDRGKTERGAGKHSK